MAAFAFTNRVTPSQYVLSDHAFNHSAINSWSAVTVTSTRERSRSMTRSAEEPQPSVAMTPGGRRHERRISGATLSALSASVSAVLQLPPLSITSSHIEAINGCSGIQSTTGNRSAILTILPKRLERMEALETRKVFVTLVPPNCDMTSWHGSGVTKMAVYGHK